MSLLATLVAATAAFVPQNIQLPPERAPEPVRVQPPATEIERFQRDLVDLLGSGPHVERTLQRMANEYPRIETLIIERLRAARARELLALSVVARRFGATRENGACPVADEILFQLLARPTGEATPVLVETLAQLAGKNAKKSLQELVHGRIAAARSAAVDVLARMATAEDLHFALLLSSEQSLDQQLAGIQLLAAVPEPRARQRLCELLAKNPTVAGAACSALIAIGRDAVEPLQALLDRPVVDRAPVYAAFALSCIADATGAGLLQPAWQGLLAKALQSPDALTRGLAAVPLAALAFAGHSEPGRDAQVVAVLLDVVEPTVFVPNLDLLRRPSTAVLTRLTGRVQQESLRWREWWEVAKNDFVAMRAQIELAPADHGLIVLELRDGDARLRVLGEELANATPVEGATEYVLETAAMRQLIERLQQQGFMAAEQAAPPGYAAQRVLQLRVRDARTQVVAPKLNASWFDAMATTVRHAVERELWQQLRHPAEEPERGAFWRSERRWLAEHQLPAERMQRLLHRLLRVWQVTPQPVRARTLAFLFEEPQRALLTAQDGAVVIERLEQLGQLGAQEQLLLQLAASAPGDEVWRSAIGLADRLPGGGRRAVEQLFALLGADRVLAALGDERPQVRRAALEEVVRSQDVRAGELVLGLFADPAPEVASSAVYAAGQLRLAAARRPLTDLVVADDTDPLLRRVALRSLGRVGGEGVFAILQRALGAPAVDDRDAALQGLGELREPRAARLLAEIYAAGPEGRSGQLARYHLERMGAALAVPALRTLLQTPNQAVRTQLVLLLGGYQDPAAVPDLIELLRLEIEPLAVANLLGATTGLDVTGADDRLTLVERWYRDHRDEPQWQWLVQALDANKVRHSLTAAQFAGGTALEPVPELARLLVELGSGRLRVMTAAVLRSVTGEEFGIVTPSMPRDQLEAIADRYRIVYESARAARGR